MVLAEYSTHLNLKLLRHNFYFLTAAAKPPRRKKTCTCQFFSCFAYFCVCFYTPHLSANLSSLEWMPSSSLLDTSASFHTAHRSVRRPGVEIGYWNLQPAAVVAALPESIFSLSSHSPLDVCITCISLNSPLENCIHATTKPQKNLIFRRIPLKVCSDFYFFRMVYSLVYETASFKF